MEMYSRVSHYKKYVEARANRAPRMRVLPETNAAPAPLWVEVGLGTVLRAVLFAATELSPVPVVAAGVMTAAVTFSKRT